MLSSKLTGIASGAAFVAALIWCASAHAEPTITELPGAQPLMVEGNSVAQQTLTDTDSPEQPPAEDLTGHQDAPSNESLAADVIAPIGCRLPTLSFSRGSSTLTREGQTKLDAVAACMAARADLRLWVMGRADPGSDGTYDWVLAFERADAAVDYLVSKGVYRGRLVPVGAGTVGSSPASATFDVVRDARLERATTANE